MFKLIKIINSGVNVPEPVRLSKASETVITEGTALTISGGLVINCGASVAPRYIAIAAAPEGTTDVLCYEITEGMRFAAPATVAPTAYTVGAQLNLAVNATGSAYGVGSVNTNGVATVASVDGAQNVGDTVTVKF
jgi:hypothetical protein